MCLFFFSSRRRHTRFKCDWSSDVCSSDLPLAQGGGGRSILMPAYGFRRAGFRAWPGGNRRCAMKLPLLLAIAALGLCGCASTPKSGLATSYDDVDHARMAIIEEQAARSGVRVFWMNPPRK